MMEEGKPEKDMQQESKLSYFEIQNCSEIGENREKEIFHVLVNNLGGNSGQCRVS